MGLGIQMIETSNLLFVKSQFKAKVDLLIGAGRFVIKTISSEEELRQAFLLRYQVFQVEMIGHANTPGEDRDEFDHLSDHLAVFDTKTNQMIATCRLNCSLFSSQFYSEQEFQCSSLLQRPGTKLELGRVCVHKDFRKGIIIILLWRALAEYMNKTDTKILFGCGSVSTLDPQEAVVLYLYLKLQGKLREELGILPTPPYGSEEFEKLLSLRRAPLNAEEISHAESLLPSLCKSYFDIGCYTPGAPAFDHDFKCIDFLTVLESDQLSSRVRQKMGVGL
jgi:putative hemolysin